MDDSIINEIEDTSEAVEFNSRRNLYLIPIRRVFITAILAKNAKISRCVSNWEIMEKLKQLIKPDLFITLKLVRSSPEFMCLEGDVNNKSLVRTLITRMDGICLKLNSLLDPIAIRVAEVKVPFPLKSEWDSFFKDSKNMNGMKAGERPDTVHIRNLPITWFIDESCDKNDGKPSENIVKECFNSFGAIRQIDIPILDKYRSKMLTSSAKRTSKLLDNSIVFEIFIQFKEYIGFVRTMNSIKGMKLLYYDKKSGRKLTSLVSVDFDKTKHLSDKNVRKRAIERRKFQMQEYISSKKNVQMLSLREEILKDTQNFRDDQDVDRQQIDKQDNVVDENSKGLGNYAIKQSNQDNFSEDDLSDEEKQKELEKEIRKNLIIHRKLQSIRLLGELLNRVKQIKQREELKKTEGELEKERILQIKLAQQKEFEEKDRKYKEEKKLSEALLRKEEELRKRILCKVKLKEYKKAEMKIAEKFQDHANLDGVIITKVSCKRQKFE